MATVIRLVTLGGLALLEHDGPVSGAAGRGRNLALMALLARAGEAGISRDRLVAYLWPESNEPRARHSLDQALYMLRKAVGPEAFRSVAGGLTLAPDVGSDVAAFEGALEEGDAAGAIELYSGPFLDGFHLSGAPGFERWVDTERAELERRYAGALEDLARTAGEAGDGPVAVELWRRRVALSPLSSRVTLELMRALQRAGDRTKALEAARVHEALVREELGARPDPSVLEYVDTLRAPKAGPPRSGDSTPRSVHAPVENAEARRRDRPGGAVGAAGAAGGAGGTGTTSARSASVGNLSVRNPGARNPKGRTWLAFGVGIVVVLSVAFLSTRRPPAPTSPAGVGVTMFANLTGDPALDPLARMAADWVAEGLARTGLVRVMRHAGGSTEVASLVEGRIYRTGDSLWLQANVRGAQDGILVRALDPVAADPSAPSGALETLRGQVLGAVGTLHDPRIATFAESALRPPSFEAYQAFAAGMDRYGVRDLPGMAESFRRAVRLDPDYLSARLWLAWTAMLMDDPATADNLIRSLEVERDRMSPMERAWHDRQLALLAGDHRRSYEAAVRMAELDPRSGWVVALADAALTLNRPAEAIAAIEDAELEALGPVRDHGASLLTAALHAVGDYRAELEVTDATILAIGLDWDFVGPGIRALAALGRIDAVEVRLEELWSLPPAYGLPRGPQSLLAAVVELRAHGYGEEAGGLVDRVLAERRARADVPAGAADAAWLRVELLYELGRWREAQGALAALSPGPVDFRHGAMTALLAVRLGDPAAGRAADADLATLDLPYTFGEPTAWRARLSAALGEDDRALRLVRQALAEGQGSRFRWVLHTRRDFEGLRERAEFRSLYE